MGTANPIRQTVKRGLELPISGAPQGTDVAPPKDVAEVAVVAPDYIGMRPSMKVKVGDAVQRGQVLFEDRKNPGVVFTAPGAGEVAAVHRGEKRALLSVVIRLSDRDGDAGANEVSYASLDGKVGNPGALTAQDVRAVLQETGLWTALRQRPFAKVPAVDARFSALFVTATSSHPLAPSAAAIVQGREEALAAGLSALVTLADGAPVYFCRGPELQVAVPQGVTVAEFSGKHPAGTPGYHIHRLHPASRERIVGYIDWQDVMALGDLLATGKQNFEKVVALAGPGAANPRHLRVRLGARLADVTRDETAANVRIISGSVLHGRAADDERLAYLGRYANQITVLPHDESRHFLGWLAPGFKKFSVTRLFASSFVRPGQYAFSDDRCGGHRTMVPFGTYDKVNAFDIMPVFLLRALLSEDLEQAEALGALELDEEDVAVFTYVCPSKNEYGPVLRHVLTRIEKEG